MASDVCFAASVRLNHHQPQLLHTVRRDVRCTLAPDQTNTSQTSLSDKRTNSTHRILSENLPKSERPPLPPIHKSVPWIGFFLEELLGIGTKSYEKSEKYGRIFTSRYVLGHHAYLSDYHAITNAIRDVDVFRSDGASDTFKALFGEDNMITTDFEAHARSRNAVAPAFSPALFPYYFKIIQRRVRATWEDVLAKVARDGEVKFTEVFREHYLSIAIELTTGVDMTSDDASQIIEKFSRLQLGFFTPPFGPLWDIGTRARDDIMAILADVVRRDLKERAETINKLREYGDDIMKLGVKDITTGEVDILLVLIANSSLSTEPDAPIDEEVVVSLCWPMLLLWTAGYQTSAVTSMCTSFEMGLDESIHAKLVAEQDAIVAEAGGDVAVTYEQTVSEMPLLDSFITEMLRLHPAAPAVGRKIVKDVEILGRFVSKDTKIFCDIEAAHRNANIYPDPHTIVVDRFLKREGQPKPPPVLSFGAPGSPHYCIGALLAKVLMKTTFATLLREYTYKLKPGQTTKYRVFPEPVPKSDVVVNSFQRREKA